MTKLKLILVTLFALTLAACGSPEPNEPFLGKWSLDGEMTLEKNRGLPADLRAKFRNEFQELTFDISDSEVNTMMITNRNLSEYERKRKYQKMFAKPDAADQPEDATMNWEQSKVSYTFWESTVTVEIEGQKKITTLDFTFIADPAKLTLKSPRSDPRFPPRIIFLREEEYMILRTPVAGEKMLDLYFIKQEN